MTNRFRSHVRGARTFTAVAAALVLAGCNPSGSVDRSQTAAQIAALPALPATLPLAPGDVTAPAYAPAAALLPATRPIRSVRVADPRDSYAYADDAWGFADALGDAPPDYGFDYGDAQPWAWQGYDNSVAFVEPLDDGYRYYYYRPGADTPYFVRDPDYGYGYDNGQLAVVYDTHGGVVPYSDYGPRLDYASRYYARGRDLYQASRQRRPVIAANWAARRAAIVDTQRWAAARASQQAWQDYHQRTEGEQAQHWREEQARRRADTVRFAAWQGQDFRSPPPPRAIPAAWTRANWAQDQRRFAPPATGFNGDAAARERAATQERERVARDAREPARQNPGTFVATPGMQRLQPQDQQRADFARQQAERAQRARALGDQRLAVQQPQHEDVSRQQAAARDAQVRARQQADRAAGEQAQQRQAKDRAQAEQRAQAAMQEKRQEQARQGREQAQRQAQQRTQIQAQAQQRQAAQVQPRALGQARAQEQAARAQQRQAAQTQQRAQIQAQAQQRQAAQVQQRAQGQARAQEQALQAQQRQAAQIQQRAKIQAQAQQRQAAQVQQRAQGQARAQEQALQAQQRQAAQAQQRAQIQAQAQQRQAAQAQQRAEVQARQRPASPPPRAHPAPEARPQPAAPAARVNPGNGGGHKHEPH
jgi:hypothetical protein